MDRNNSRTNDEWSKLTKTKPKIPQNHTRNLLHIYFWHTSFKSIQRSLSKSGIHEPKLDKDWQKVENHGPDQSKFQNLGPLIPKFWPKLCPTTSRTVNFGSFFNKMLFYIRKYFFLIFEFGWISISVIFSGLAKRGITIKLVMIIV